MAEPGGEGLACLLGVFSGKIHGLSLSTVILQCSLTLPPQTNTSDLVKPDAAYKCSLSPDKRSVSVWPCTVGEAEASRLRVGVSAVALAHPD